MSQELETPFVETAKRSADNRLSIGDGVRFLTDALANEYIWVPPDGGLLMPGMLPQAVEADVLLRAMVEAFAATTKG